ncbi:hypothetical protein TcasGA2_TC033235 [Tribolium castaneum]|uniref:Uncharacterized protein n=1 Tax=Tribolium castaneum TaxID=7070 RepID=A0A139WHN3_TRICA|nr:hypothetical protein TcasGA2_TC033235 [Tribolium castaneum]
MHNKRPAKANQSEKSNPRAPKMRRRTPRAQRKMARLKRETLPNQDGNDCYEMGLDETQVMRPHSSFWRSRGKATKDFEVFPYA